MATNNTDRVEAATERGTGLLASLQRLLGSFTEILQTRLGILSTEVEEAGLIVGQLISYAVVAVFFFALGLLFITVFIIKVSPESYQLYVLGGFAVLYLLVAVIFVWRLMHKLRTRPRLFSSTLSELEKDRHHLGTRT